MACAQGMDPSDLKNITPVTYRNPPSFSSDIPENSCWKKNIWTMSAQTQKDNYFWHNKKRWTHTHDEIENGFETFVLLMEGLLVSNSEYGEQPHEPLHIGRPAVGGKLLNRQPRKVGASYEYVDHCPITSVQNVSQLAAKTNMYVVGGLWIN